MFCLLYCINQHFIVYMSRLVGKPTMWFPNRSDTNRPVQAQKRARKVQVGKDQEKAQSEKDSHSKNRGGKKTN